MMMIYIAIVLVIVIGFAAFAMTGSAGKEKPRKRCFKMDDQGDGTYILRLSGGRQIMLTSAEAVDMGLIENDGKDEG